MYALSVTNLYIRWLPISFEDWKAESDYKHAADMEKYSGEISEADWAKYQKKLATYEKEIDKYEDRMEVWDHARKHNLRTDVPPIEWFDPERPPFPPEPPIAPTPPDPPRPRLKDNDMPNFLKLSAALSILLARKITRQQLDLGSQYLTDYLLGFREVSGS